MNTFAKFSAIAALAVLSTTGVMASPLGDLQSANSVSIQTVSGTSDNPLVSANGVVMERVDLNSLHARIAQNAPVLRQLEAFGASVDDVIGITGSNQAEITLYVRS